ncbi:MAG: MinD/ParA family protein [Deltaproteobacteria bacterium]|nr:MinD/ParA family protein [Deltaproteobacteria bacterium]
MNHKAPPRKVISLTRRIAGKKAATEKRKRKIRKSHTRVIAVTSGKGGVGKSNIVANLGFVLSRSGKKVLILDADLGLGNLDVLLGLTPKYNLSHAITGSKTISEIVIEGPGNVKILPAPSGIQELSNLTDEQETRMFTALDLLIDSVDLFLIDTGAGISSNVMHFNSSAPEIMVVASPEPTSITDAYALMKVLSLDYSRKHFKLVVNLARSSREAFEVYKRLALVADRFLDIKIEYMGHVLIDENIKKGVRLQKVVSEIHPDAKASRCFAALAKKIFESRPSDVPEGDTNFFWRKLVRNGTRYE